MELIKENMLFCKSTPGRTIGNGLFKFFLIQHKTKPWIFDKCIAICINGAKAITDKDNAAYRMDLLLSLLTCVYDKKIPYNLQNVLSEAVNIVNFFRVDRCRLDCYPHFTKKQIARIIHFISILKKKF